MGYVITSDPSLREERHVNAAGEAERHIDRGLALALPVLVVMSCLPPLLGLLLRGVSPWIPLTAVLLLAISACTFLLQERGLALSLGLSVASVLLGSGCLALLGWAVSILGNAEDQATIDIANGIATALPVFLAILALVTVALSFRALPKARVALGIAWLVAVAAPFVLAFPIFALSGRAGNAGMDVVALFFLPLAAFFIWVFLFIGSLLLWRRQDVVPE